MVVLAGFAGFSYVLFLVRLSHALPVDPAWAEQWQTLLRQRGISRPIRLVATQSTGPALCWTPRGYRICLPCRFWAELAPSQRLSVLRHELAHFERFDLWTLLLAKLLALPHWFNPFAWWALRQVVESIEWACDQAAGERREDAVQLAKALLRLGVVKSLGLCHARPSRGTSLFVRIRRLVQFKSPENSFMKKVLLMVLATGLVAANLVRIELVAKEPGEDPTPADTVADKATVENGSAAGAARAAPPRPVRNYEIYASWKPYGAPVPTEVDAGSRRAVDGGRPSARTYTVADVLRRIGEDQGLSEPESRDFLKHWLRTAVQPVQPTLPAGSSHEPSAGQRRHPLDVVWSGDGLLIETTAAGHERITEALKAIREYGLVETTIQILFLTGPADELQRAGRNWTLLPLDLPENAGPQPHTALFSAFDRPLGSLDGTQSNRARVAIEKNPPVMYQILDEDAARKALDGWQANPRVYVLQAPRITLLNCQTAFVADAAQSPFVVGLQDGKPQIRVVSEGTFLRLRPLLDREGKMKLDFAVTLSHIRNVEAVTVSGTTVSDAPDKGVTVQVPEMEMARVEARVEMPLKRWLLLGGLERRSREGKPESAVERGLRRLLLPAGLEIKKPDGKPESVLVMLWAGKPQDAPKGPFPWRRD